MRCSGLLRCGHRCTSLCGEPCEGQICVTCAPEEEKAILMDVITNNTISNLNLDSNELDSILIRLACGHIFTVETLDSICKLQKFYSSSPDGRWTGLSPPPSESAPVPPTCPTCRGSITARRYGRVYKRANLDMLERTMATKMSRELIVLGNRASMLPIWSLRDEFSEADIRRGGEPRSTEKRRNPDSSGPPLNYEYLWSLEIHGITEEESQDWTRLLMPLLQLYKAVTGVAATRSAHVTAYDAAISVLYHHEIAVLTAKPRPTASPQDTALRLAKQLVGTSPPLADKRFRVEAIWLSVELRYAIGSIALSRLRRIRSVAKSRDGQRVVVWSAFVQFIFESCINDAYLAHKIASDCGAAVQSLEAVVKYCRAVLEHAKVGSSVAQLMGRFVAEGNHWVSGAERLKAQAALLTSDEERIFLARRGSQALELDLVESKLTRPMNSVLSQWDEFIVSLSCATFLGPPPSKAELSAIVKAFPDSEYPLLSACCAQLLIIVS
jgi:hypothetical protein